MNLLLVSVPAERGKRAHFGRLPFQNPTNYGLIAVGSAALEQGHHVLVFEPSVDCPRSQEPTDQLVAFESVVGSRRWDVIGFSCLSGFSYPALDPWSATARRLAPRAYLIAGGQDHVGRIPEITLEENPALDAVVLGEGEGVLVSLLQELSQGVIPTAAIGLATRHHIVKTSAVSAAMPVLRYDICNEFRRLPASVEFARGCPFTCDFCVSAGSGFRRRSPSDLVHHIRYTSDMYSLPDLPLYLEAPLFVAPRSYLLALRHELAARDLRPIWRAETRVDILDPADAMLLWECGMRVVDLGLESGSAEMLKLMGKTSNAERYLARAVAIIRALSSAGIFVKLNILFSAGESPHSLAETKEFLAAHRSYIGAVAAYPLVMYPGIEGEVRILRLLEECGGSLVTTPEWTRRHLAPVNVSRHFQYDDLLEIAHTIERDFQSIEEYFYQRRFGYFAPGISFGQFSEMVMTAGSEVFPFRVAASATTSQREPSRVR